MSDDPNLAVTILQRTAEDKYLRLDVGSPDEVVGGFPRRREKSCSPIAPSFWQRRGGVIHARSTAHAGRLRQQARRRSADAGRPAVLCGRWLGRAPVAEVLPVEMDSSNARGGKSLRATRATRALECASDPSWCALPRHATLQKGKRRRRTSGTACPGHGRQRRAQRKARRHGSADWQRRRRGQEQIVLAYQRYGRGKSPGPCRSRTRGCGKWTRRCRSRT